MGTLKPSIEYALLPLLPFTPLCSLHPLCSPLLPFPLSPTEVVGTVKPSIEYALLPFVPTEVVGTLKPSIQYALPPSPTLVPSCTCIPPIFTSSLCPPLLPSLPFIPFTSFTPLHSLHPPSPPLPPFALLHSPLSLAPTEVVGTLQPSIECTLFPFTPFAPLCPLTPCPHRGGGDPKTYYTICFAPLPP